MSEEELILNNQRLIYKVIKDLHCYWRTEDEFQDLYDAGLLGLVRGAKKYDGSSTPGTYFYTCIKNEINKYIYLSCRDKRKIHKDIMISLDKEVKSESETTYLDFLEDPNVNLEEDLLKKLEVEKVLKAIDTCLTPLQRLYICHYYGINGYKQMPFREIAEEYNCSHQNIQSKVRQAIKNIKNYLTKNKKDIFAEEIREKKQLIKCIGCRKLKSISDFSISNSRSRKPYCKVCEERHNNMFKESV